MAFIRSISGLRATLGDDLTPDLVAAYAAAFSAILPSGPIVVGNDGRPSGAWIEGVVLQSLRACGRSVRMTGMVPTPTVQLLTEHSDAVGGIIVTASHNPAAWNGLKFLGPDGVFLNAAANQRLWDAVDHRAFVLSADQQAGSVEILSDAVELHLQRILALDVVKGAPQAQGERVVVDAVNASGSRIVPDLLRTLGYTVVELSCDGSGIFPHTPEPIPENLSDLAEAVRQQEASFGVAVDPDADRLVLIDETGTPIGEERTIALAAQSVYDAGAHGPVVVNYSTSRTVDHVAAHYGETCVRSAVGEINVVDRMREVHAVIGGEGSGGVIYPACHMGRDSIVGLALITALLRRQRQTLRQAVERLPVLHMIKSKITLQDRSAVPMALERVAAHFPDAVVGHEDGVYLSWPDQWAHIRASNTEPIMRIIAEAPDESSVAALVTQIAAVVGVH